MAGRRKEETSTNGAGKSKIRFRYMDADRSLDFSVENMAGESVTEGLRSIANALAGRTIVLDPRRKLAAGAGAPPVEVEEDEVETPEEVLEPQNVEDSVEEDHAEEQGPAKPRPRRAPKAPKLISDPKLTDAKVPLADFMKQKNPQVMMDKYAVVAVWYKEQFQITEISIDHIFSAFKHLGIESTLPTDISQTLRNLTHVRKWFDKGKGEGTYSINWLGESEVGKMGSKAGAA